MCVFPVLVDPARAIEKMLGKLDDEDKETLNWLIRAAQENAARWVQGDEWRDDEGGF